MSHFHLSADSQKTGSLSQCHCLSPEILNVGLKVSGVRCVFSVFTFVVFRTSDLGGMLSAASVI